MPLKLALKLFKDEKEYRNMIFMFYVVYIIAGEKQVSEKFICSYYDFIGKLETAHLKVVQV